MVSLFWVVPSWWNLTCSLLNLFQEIVYSVQKWRQNDAMGILGDDAKNGNLHGHQWLKCTKLTCSLNPYYVYFTFCNPRKKHEIKLTECHDGRFMPSFPARRPFYLGHHTAINFAVILAYLSRETPRSNIRFSPLSCILHDQNDALLNPKSQNLSQANRPSHESQMFN